MSHGKNAQYGNRENCKMGRHRHGHSLCPLSGWPLRLFRVHRRTGSGSLATITPESGNNEYKHRFSQWHLDGGERLFSWVSSPESFLVQSGTIVGRTSAMTGSLVISDNTISSGSIQVDLSKLTIGDKQNSSFLKILDTNSYPSATLT